MTGEQKGAYRLQSIALVCACFALIAFILDEESVGIFLLIVVLGCLVKAMMIRESWELSFKRNAYIEWLREQENGLD